MAVALADVRGARLLGACLSGSAVEGGLRPASDLDVVAVVDEPLADGERRALVARLLAASGRRSGGRPIECTLVVRADIEPWRYPPQVHLLFGEWLIDPTASCVDDDVASVSGPRPDLAFQVDLARRRGRVLTGCPPDRLLPPVPSCDLQRAARESVPGLVEDLVGDERNVLLTFARLWCTPATGDLLPKDRAAVWAAARLSERSRRVMDHARRLYLESTYAEERWPAGLREQVPAVVEEIRSRLE